VSGLAEQRHPKTARTRPVNLDARENECHGSNSVLTFVPFTTVINTNAGPASRHKHPPRPRAFYGRGLVRRTPHPNSRRSHTTASGAPTLTLEKSGCAGFTTALNSSRATTDGNLGGTAGADAFCQRAADAAHLTGTFQAWLSTGSTNAIDRLQGVGPWSTPAGDVAFDGRPDLAGPPLVDLTDELGDALPAKAVAWTGSDGDGPATGTDCSRWTATDTAARGAIGDGLADSGHWGGGAGATPCSMQASLVCFER